MTKKEERQLETLRKLASQLGDAQLKAESASGALTRSMRTARKMGLSLRTIAEVTGMSNVAVLQRTRDDQGANAA